MLAYPLDERDFERSMGVSVMGRIGWIRETLENPEEIRRDFVKEFPFREIYLNTVYESEKDRMGEPFLVVVDRRVTLHFWTAFAPSERYLQRVKRGKLLWRPEN